MTEMKDSDYKRSADILATCLGEMLCMDGNESGGPSVENINKARNTLLVYRRKSKRDEKELFERYARISGRGVDPEWYGYKVRYDVRGVKIRDTYEVCGLDLSRPVNCIKLVSKSGFYSWVSPGWVASRMGVLVPSSPSRKRAIQL